MRRLLKNLSLISIVAIAISLGLSTNAANLTSVSIQLSSHNVSQTLVTETINFKPATSIGAPGEAKITWPSAFDLTAVAASTDVTVSGGGVTWNAVINGNLDLPQRILTLSWASGTLTVGNTVTITVARTKNPTSSGNYNIVMETGASGFVTATDSRTIPVVITNAGVAVMASVPYPPTQPTVTNITPVETIIVSSGASQVISFTLTDVNNDNISYTVTPLSGTISVSPSPVSPVSGTSSGVTVTFTYFANGSTGSVPITVTANDGNTAVANRNIDVFVI